jgi:hypothetical protein
LFNASDCTGSKGSGDELLDILTKFSPNSLTNISISEGWKYSIDALKIFFESCREQTLQYFEFTINNNDCITEEHEAIVSKYLKEGVIAKYPYRKWYGSLVVKNLL